MFVKVLDKAISINDLLEEYKRDLDFIQSEFDQNPDNKYIAGQLTVIKSYIQKLERLLKWSINSRTQQEKQSQQELKKKCYNVKKT